MLNDTYDTKTKKKLDSVVVGDTTYTVGCRVDYVGSSPCFIGRTGTLTKIKKSYLSKRQANRAGFSGRGGTYYVTFYVLWADSPHSPHPQSCSVAEVALATGTREAQR